MESTPPYPPLHHAVPWHELEGGELNHGGRAPRPRVTALPARPLRPDGGDEDTNDGHVAVGGDDDRPMEDVRVVEDDRDLSDVEDDGEDEVRHGDVVEGPSGCAGPMSLSIWVGIRGVRGGYRCGMSGSDVHPEHEPEWPVLSMQLVSSPAPVLAITLT